MHSQFIPHRVLAAFFITLIVTPLARAEGTYFTTKSVLTEFFAKSERVGYETLDVSRAEGALRAALGELPPKRSYTIFIARTGERVDGYAIVDEERGQHLPITFATQLSPAGMVVRSEVMAYREGYGEEIRSPRFRAQFVGKKAGDSTHDIVAVSGASISSRAMTRAVTRAAALVAAWRALSESETS